AVDTEYKAGDDMLYAQYVHGNGDDVQFAHVVRRDPLTGDVTADESTTAVKYHGFAGSLEYDVLLARSYDDDVLGIGLRRAIGGAEWGADAVLTRTTSDTYLQLVTNVSYSWTLRGRNVTGLAEYHYSGVGQRSGRYSPADFVANPELLARLLRGQSFTIGRHYLAGSATIELTPLWTMTPLLLTNVADPSALLQLTSQWSLTDNTVLLASLSVPLGGSGTEFGGIPAGIPDRFLSLRARAFVQFAGYF
ncbi:MAG: hypothetical protein R3288_12225, partial [Woeseiaceae bacterium]|nr:hypothetical protein [Woeseiaceae bacterium]